MNDTSDPDRPAPRHTRIALVAGVVILVVAGAVGGGYFVGRSDRVVAAADPCAEIRQEMLDMRAEADAKPDRAADITRVQANMVLQNPECFPAKLRAAVQAGLDAADQQAAARALCGASDRPWWEC